MTGTLTKATTNGAIARPLKVLVPLIKDDLAKAKDAAERAGLPYYQAAGEKMIEAKSQLNHGEFTDWMKRNFDISIQHARKYMRLAEHSAGQKESADSFSSLADFVRQTAKNPSDETYGRSYGQTSAWHGSVKEVVKEIDTETLNIKREEMNRQEERDAQHKLALQLIDIGYKVLARELHPDKGGSRDAMSRLNTVRDRLKQHA